MAEAMEPRKIEATLAFMFETCRPYRVAEGAMGSPTLQEGYDGVWSGFVRAEVG